MSKRVKKGKNAQKKKQRKVTEAGSRSSTTSVAQQRLLYEEDTPKAELGAGVRVRSKGTTMSLGVRILVGIMAFTMLTMMGVVSYSSMNNFDIVEWLTGEDVAPGTTSSTNSATAMTKAQRSAMDATNQFDGFFIVDEESGLSLTDVNSSRQTSETATVSKKYKEDADSKRDEILAQDKEKIDRLKERKDAREDAKQNNPFNKFFDGLGQFRDAVVALFSNTYDGLTGNNRAETSAENPETTDDVPGVASDEAVDYNVDAGSADATQNEPATTETKDENADSGKATDANASQATSDNNGKSLQEALADANGLTSAKPESTSPLGGVNEGGSK